MSVHEGQSDFQVNRCHALFITDILSDNSEVISKWNGIKDDLLVNYPVQKLLIDNQMKKGNSFNDFGYKTLEKWSLVEGSEATFDKLLFILHQNGLINVEEHLNENRDPIQHLGSQKDIAELIERKCRDDAMYAYKFNQSENFKNKDPTISDLDKEQNEINLSAKNDDDQSEETLVIDTSELPVNDEELFKMETLLEAQTRIFGENHSDTIQTKFNIGVILENRLKWDEALKIHEEVLATLQHTVGEDDPRIKLSKFHITKLLQQRGDQVQSMEEFTTEFNDTLSTFTENVVSDGTPQPQPSISPEDISEGRQAYENLKINLGDQHVLTKATKLILDFSNTIMHAEAEESDMVTKQARLTQLLEEFRFEELFSLIFNQEKAKELLGIFQDLKILPESNFIGIEISKILFVITDSNLEGIKKWIEIYDLQRHVLGEDHEDTLGTGANLSVWKTNTVYLLSLLDEAEYIEIVQNQLNDTLKINENLYGRLKRILGETHSHTIKVMYNIAIIWQVQGRFDDALAMADEIYEIQSQIFEDDENSPSILSAKQSIARLLREKKNIDQSLEMYKEILEISRNSDVTHLVTVSTLCAIGYLQYEKNLIRNGINNWKEACEILKENENDDDLSLTLMMSIMRILSNMLEKDERIDEAMSVYNDILNIQQKFGEENLYLVFFTKNNIAKILVQKDEFEEAVHVFEQAMEAHAHRNHNSSVEVDLEIFDIKFKFAELLFRKKQFALALKIYNEIYTDELKILKENYDDKRQTKFFIALTLDLLGQKENALNIHRDVYEIRKQNLGETNIKTLDSLLKIAILTTELGRWREGLNLFKELYKYWSELNGDEDEYTLVAKEGMARLYGDLGEYNEALNIYNELYNIKVRLNGPEDNSTLVIKCSIALLLFFKGNYTEAMKIYQDIFKFSKQILGEKHYITLVVQHNIADLYSNLGNIDKSLLIFKEIYEYQKNEFGENDLNTSDAKMGYAEQLSKKGNKIEALQMFNEILEIQIQILPKEHPTILSIMFHITQNMPIAQVEDAIKLTKEIYQTQVQVLNENHYYTLLTKRGLAKLLAISGQKNEALKMYEEVIQVEIQIFGDEHPETIKTKNELDNLINKKYKLCSCIIS